MARRKNTRTQKEMIIDHINKAGHITCRQAIIDYSIPALPRRICDLEEMGFRFDRKWAKHPVTGQEYVQYRLHKDSPRGFAELRLAKTPVRG